MRTIYKYPLEIKDKQIIQVRGMKENFAIQNQLLHVGVQKGIPCLWCLADEGEPMREMEILMVGTGHKLEHDWMDTRHYLGTVMLHDGDLVLHLFILMNGWLVKDWGK